MQFKVAPATRVHHRCQSNFIAELCELIPLHLVSIYKCVISQQGLICSMKLHQNPNSTLNCEENKQQPHLVKCCIAFETLQLFLQYAHPRIRSVQSMAHTVVI